MQQGLRIDLLQQETSETTLQGVSVDAGKWNNNRKNKRSNEDAASTTYSQSDAALSHQ